MYNVLIGIFKEENRNERIITNIQNNTRKVYWSENELETACNIYLKK